MICDCDASVCDSETVLVTARRDERSVAVAQGVDAHALGRILAEFPAGTSVIDYFMDGPERSPGLVVVFRVPVKPPDTPEAPTNDRDAPGEVERGV